MLVEEMTSIWNGGGHGRSGSRSLTNSKHWPVAALGEDVDERSYRAYNYLCCMGGGVAQLVRAYGSYP
jgi:hypothetical protein